MKKLIVLILIACSTSSFSYLQTNSLYDLGYATGSQLGRSETYVGQNAQVVQNTINLQLDPEYFTYKMGVLEGYIANRFIGSFYGGENCSWTYFNDKNRQWETKNGPCATTIHPQDIP